MRDCSEMDLCGASSFQKCSVLKLVKLDSDAFSIWLQ